MEDPISLHLSSHLLLQISSSHLVHFRPIFIGIFSLHLPYPSSSYTLLPSPFSSLLPPSLSSLFTLSSHPFSSLSPSLSLFRISPLLSPLRQNRLASLTPLASLFSFSYTLRPSLLSLSLIDRSFHLLFLPFIPLPIQFLPSIWATSRLFPWKCAVIVSLFPFRVYFEAHFSPSNLLPFRGIG